MSPASVEIASSRFALAAARGRPGAWSLLVLLNGCPGATRGVVVVGPALHDRSAEPPMCGLGRRIPARRLRHELNRTRVHSALQPLSISQYRRSRLLARIPQFAYPHRDVHHVLRAAVRQHLQNVPHHHVTRVHVPEAVGRSLVEARAVPLLPMLGLAARHFGQGRLSIYGPLRPA